MSEISGSDNEKPRTVGPNFNLEPEAAKFAQDYAKAIRAGISYGTFPVERIFLQAAVELNRHALLTPVPEYQRPEGAVLPPLVQDMENVRERVCGAIENSLADNPRFDVDQALGEMIEKTDVFIDAYGAVEAQLLMDDGLEGLWEN